MRQFAALFLLLLTLSACAAPAEVSEEEPPAPPPQAAPEDPAPEEETPSGDFPLLTLEAPLADGRTLTLEAVGKKTDQYSFGVREVRVYDGEELLQTVQAREATQAEWGEGMAEDFYYYTTCWSQEEAMEALDLNFDGSTDFGLFGWPANNTIPYYYWTWDPDAEQYQYAFVLQGVEVHPETEELTAEYKDGPAGALWVTERYQFDENGRLVLTSREEEDVRDDQA